MDLGALLTETNPLLVDVALLIGRVTIGVCFTLLCNLVVLPALIALRWRRTPGSLVEGRSRA